MNVVKKGFHGAVIASWIAFFALFADAQIGHDSISVTVGILAGISFGLLVSLGIEVLTNKVQNMK